MTHQEHKDLKRFNIGVMVTIIMQMVAVAFFMGGLNESVKAQSDVIAELKADLKNDQIQRYTISDATRDLGIISEKIKKNEGHIEKLRDLITTRRNRNATT